MSQTITKSIGEGFAHNPIYAALAYDSTDHFGGYEIKDVMHNTTYKEYFYDTNTYIYASASGTLDLVGTTIAITGNVTISGALSYGSETVSLSQDLQGTLTVGVNDTGYDVKFYGDGTGKYWLWDTDKDTNEGGVTLVGTFGMTGAMTITGALSVSSTSTLTGNVTLAGTLTSGTSNDGNNVTLYGDAGSGAWKWVYDQDANGGVLLVGSFLQTGDMTLTGALTVGVNETGHDVIFYGTTDAKYWMWDEGNDQMTLAGASSLAGAVTIVGTVGITGDVTMATQDQINFENTATYIHASATNKLDLIGPTVTITATTGLIHKYDAASYVTQTVSDAGAVKVTVVGDSAGSYEIETDDAGITLDAANNITLDAGTGDVDFTTDALFATTEKCQFNDTGTYVYSSTNGQLDVMADVKVQVTGTTTVDIESTDIVLDADVTIDGTHTLATGTGAITLSGAITLADAVDIAVNTTTGTKIGTATAQKLGFWNVTPVIQQAAAAQADQGAMTATLTDVDTETDMTAAQAATIVADLAALDVLLTAIRTALVNTGIMKGAA